MNDTKLRSKLIHLAHEHPEFRKNILPILKEAGRWDPEPEDHDRIRRSYYEFSDKVGAFVDAVNEDEILMSDPQLIRLMLKLKRLSDEISTWLDKNYNWD